MSALIEEILLRDQTTGKNIIWANNTEHEKEEITVEDIYSIEPRWEKVRELQKLRTKVRAEIFTPPEICRLQNDLIEADKKSWTDYIDAKYLEITCGEAPYLVSRYNAVTGEPIEIKNRYGLLDRKLRLVNKETSAVNDWFDWALRAVQSIYGYEFQGDNLFLARKNVFETVKDFYREKFSREPPENFLSEVAEIISWNLWQMDGRTNAIPYANTNPKIDLFGDNTAPQGEIFCKIMDWKKKQPETFKNLLGGGRR